MEIKRKYLKHGDIVEIPLKNLASFGYAKVVDPKKIEESIDLPFFLRVYYSRSEKRLDSADQINRELLLSPFYLVGQSAAITKFSWRIIANESVNISEEWIPDTKQAWPPFVEKPEKWGYIKRFDTKIIFSEYEKVKHLDDSNGKNIEVVSFVVEMECLKVQGKDIKKEFGLKNWLEEVYYKTFCELPPYSQLPEYMKGRAIK